MSMTVEHLARARSDIDDYRGFSLCLHWSWWLQRCTLCLRWSWWLAWQAFISVFALILMLVGHRYLICADIDVVRHLSCLSSCQWLWANYLLFAQMLMIALYLYVFCTDVTTGRLVATASVFSERKFLRGCGKVCFWWFSWWSRYIHICNSNRVFRAEVPAWLWEGMFLMMSMVVEIVHICNSNYIFQAEIFPGCRKICLNDFHGDPDMDTHVRDCGMICVW